MRVGSRWLMAVAMLAALLGGLGAVGAEVVFSRRLALLFGVTAPAAATVVAVYMMGMAIGASLGGRLADTAGVAAGWVYAVGEFAGAGLAVAFLPLVAVAEGHLASASVGPPLLGCAIGTVALVGPAAIFSGATFPALVRLVGRGASIRTLYACNAVGAAGGAVIAGLYAPGWLGFEGTLWAAAAVLALAGACGLVLAGRGAPAVPALAERGPGAVSLREATVAYAVIGGAGMGAEIGWTRLLEQAGPNPGSLCFSIVLGGFLLGIGLGGAVIEPRLRQLGERAALAAAACLTGTGLCVAIGLQVLIPEERLIGHLVGPGPGSAWVFDATGIQVSLDRLAVVMLGVVLPGLASGVAFPLVSGVVARERSGARLGSAAGLTAAAGIVAATAVSLWMGYLPSFGPGTVHLLVALGVAALGMAWWLGQRRVLLVLPAVGALGFVVPPWAGLQIPPDETVVKFVETAAGPSATATGREGTSIYTHGERVGGLKLDLEFPLVLHSAPRDVLLIAFGTGINVHGFTKDPAIERLRCVDIDPALPELAEELPWGRELVIDGERLDYVVADGRHLLRSEAVSYDVIYSDVATYAQYVALGTVEFFQLVRSRLSPDGMFALKLHPDTLTTRGMARFLAGFMDVFPEAALFAPRSHLPVLVGFTGPLPSKALLEARVASAPELFGATRPASLPSRVMLGPRELRRLAADAEPATDDRPLDVRRALVGPMTPQRLHGAAAHTLTRAVRDAPRGRGKSLFGWAPVGRDHWRVSGVMPVPPRRGYGAAQ